MKLRKGIMVIVILALIFSLGVSQSFAQSIRMSHEMSADTEDPTHGYMLVLQYYIESTTDMEATIYPDNVLGGMEEVIEQVMAGEIHIGQVSIGGMSHFYQDALIFNLPYGYPRDERVALKLWQPDNEFSRKVYEGIEEEVGVKPIHVFLRGGFALLSNNVRPVRSVEDMDGILFRAMDRSQIALYESLGASGVSIPWEEVYTALDTGVADGQMNPSSIFIDANFHEVQDYITYPGTFPSTGMIVVNPQWYENLSEEDRHNLDIAFEHAFVTSAGLSFRSEALAEETLIDRGVEVYHQTEEEYDEFRDTALDGVLEWAYETLGEDFTNEFLAEVERLEMELSK